MAEPLILVKKADGTSVRLPLSEVKKMQQAAASSSATPAITSEKSVTPATPPVTEPPKPRFAIPLPEDKSLPNTTDPVAMVRSLLSVQELPAAPVESLLPRAPETPLLSEDLEEHEVKHPDIVAHTSYEDAALAAVKAAKITIPPDLLGRFQSLVTSLYKGVRTMEQFLTYVYLSPDLGGLGLSEEATAKLAAALESVPGTPRVTPKKVTTVPTKPKQPIQSAQTRPTPLSFGNGRAMQDVMPPVPRPAQIMGPVEEMKQFTLTDWRRLAATPAKAKELILNKFAGLRQESYFMYQEARAAWFVSPLVSAYQQTVVSAVNEGQRLTNLTQAAPTQLSLTDISAIVEINQSLRV